MPGAGHIVVSTKLLFLRAPFHTGPGGQRPVTQNALLSSKCAGTFDKWPYGILPVRVAGNRPVHVCPGMTAGRELRQAFRAGDKLAASENGRHPRHAVAATVACPRRHARLLPMVLP